MIVFWDLNQKETWKNITDPQNHTPSLMNQQIAQKPAIHKNQPYTNTTMTASYSNVTYSTTHSSFSTFTTTVHLLINTTTPILTTWYHSTYQNITPVHRQTNPLPHIPQTMKIHCNHQNIYLHRTNTIPTQVKSTIYNHYKTQNYIFKRNKFTIQIRAIHLLPYSSLVKLHY